MPDLGSPSRDAPGWKEKGKRTSCRAAQGGKAEAWGEDG